MTATHLRKRLGVIALTGTLMLGGGVAWAAGEIPLFIVMLALAWQWFQTDMREARRGERQAERDDDAA